jgi:hypothetical protein
LRIAGTIAGLIRPLEHFENVSILLTSRLHGPQPLLRMLWRHVDSVLVAPGSESIARDSWVPPSMVSTTESYPVSGATAGVTSLGPPEIPREVWLREQSTRVVVVVLRRLLGRYYVPIRIQAGKVAGLIRRQSRRR